MMRYGKITGLLTLGAAFLAVCPLRAADKPEPASDKIAEQLAAQQNKLEKITTQLETLTKDIGALRSLSQDIEKLKGDLGDLRKELDQLKNQRVTAKKVALADAGRVRLINNQPGAVEVLVNGKSYVVEPMSNREITASEIPAGNFSYEVLGLSAGMQTRVRQANYDFNITIH